MYGIRLPSLDHYLVESLMPVFMAVIGFYGGQDRIELLYRVLAVLIIIYEPVEVIRRYFLEKSKMAGVYAYYGA